MTGEFVVTEYHLKLAQHLYWYWEEGGYEGSPAVDTKRPYGNSGPIAPEVAEVLSSPDPSRRRSFDEDMACYNREGELKQVTLPDGRVFTDKQLEELHRSMDTALQIFTSTLSFVTGTYRRTEMYDARSWKLVEPYLDSVTMRLSLEEAEQIRRWRGDPA